MHGFARTVSSHLSQLTGINAIIYMDLEFLKVPDLVSVIP
jgi:hypothetical protein